MRIKHISRSFMIEKREREREGIEKRSVSKRERKEVYMRGKEKQVNE